MNLKKIAIGGVTIAILGTTLAYAGSRHSGWGGGWGGGHGFKHGHGEHAVEHMINRLDHMLDLDDAQVTSLETIGKAAIPSLATIRDQRKMIMQRAIALDPTTADYQANVVQLSEEIAGIARERTIEVASLYQQAWSVLNEEQRTRLRNRIEKKMQRMKHKHQASH